MNKHIKFSTKSLFFLKSLLKYFALLLLPIGIIGTYSLYRFNEYTTQTIEAQNRNLMYQIKTQADSMFQTTDIISAYLSGSSSVVKTLQEIFLNDILPSDSTKKMNTLGQYLQSIIASNEYAHIAYLYFNNDFGRTFVASNNSSYMHSHSKANPLDNYLNSPVDFGIETNFVSTYSLSPDKEVITVYKMLYSAHSADLPKGILLINYSMERFREYINHFDLYPEQVIMFIQEDRVPLFQTSEEDFKDIWSQIAPNLNSEVDYKVFRIEYCGCSYAISLIPASAEGLYYVSLIPTESLYAQNRSLTAMFMLIVTVACILSILLSLISTKHEYNQLQNIINTFSAVDNEFSKHNRAPLKSSNLYQIILQNVINLFLEQHYLKLQIENKHYQMQLLELRALQHQINPHFLFNTLNTIYWEALRFTNHPNICSSMISDLSEIMAYSMTDAQNKVSIRNELEFLQHYTDIQKIRYDHKLIRNQSKLV